VGLILDSSLLVAEERENFALSAWLRSRPPEAGAFGLNSPKADNS
jgi:hypothetical protein